MSVASRKSGKAQAARFHEPLVPGDSPTQTVGCRHSNPDICSRHLVPSACAFVRTDGMCRAPSGSWPKQYAKLRAQAEEQR
jgi:hypothetical protein